MELLGDNKLDELEGKIEKLVLNFKALKEEKEQLINRVQSLEAQNQELKERAESSRNENEIIVHKIANILEKIDKVEV